jgi:hypothetical protein
MRPGPEQVRCLAGGTAGGVPPAGQEETRCSTAGTPEEGGASQPPGVLRYGTAPGVEVVLRQQATTAQPARRENYGWISHRATGSPTRRLRTGTDPPAPPHNSLGSGAGTEPLIRPGPRRLSGSTEIRRKEDETPGRWPRCGGSRPGERRARRAFGALRSDAGGPEHASKVQSCATARSWGVNRWRWPSVGC